MPHSSTASEVCDVFQGKRLTDDGTEQLMVLLSASRDAGTSMSCPGKRHLRLFCDWTWHPVQVVLMVTTSVAIFG